MARRPSSRAATILAALPAPTPDSRESSAPPACERPRNPPARKRSSSASAGTGSSRVPVPSRMAINSPSLRFSAPFAASFSRGPCVHRGVTELASEAWGLGVSMVAATCLLRSVPFVCSSSDLVPEGGDRMSAAARPRARLAAIWGDHTDRVRPRCLLPLARFDKFRVFHGLRVSPLRLLGTLCALRCVHG